MPRPKAGGVVEKRAETAGDEVISRAGVLFPEQAGAQLRIELAQGPFDAAAGYGFLKRAHVNRRDAVGIAQQRIRRWPGVAGNDPTAELAEDFTIGQRKGNGFFECKMPDFLAAGIGK